jgi:hypothetical protein
MEAPGSDDAFGDAAGGDLKIDLVPGSLPQPSLPASSMRLSSSSSPSRRYPSTNREAPPRRERSGGAGRTIFALFLLLVLAGAAAVQFGPDLAKRAVLAGAEKRGITLTVGAVEPRNGGITLTDVTLTLPQVPELSVKAKSVDVDVSWQGEARKIVVPGYELTAHGAVGDVAAHFGTWRASPRAAVALEAKAGHIVWADAIVPGVQLEGLDVSTTFGAKDEGSLEMNAPSLTVTTPRGALGPWAAHLEAGGTETKLVVSLDRSKTDGPPSVTFLARPALGLLISVAVPKTKASRIGVPADLLHATSDPELDLTLEAQVMPTGSPITSHATLSVFGIAGGADLVLAGAIAGDRGKLIHIEPGTISIGKANAKMNGTITFGDDGFRVEVERPGTKAPSGPSFVFDTRDWTTARPDAPPKPAPAPPAPPSSGRRR